MNINSEKEDLKQLIQNIYNILLKNYGYQGWFPLIRFPGTNPTKSGSIRGYHPNNYDLPKTIDEIYEVCIASILTQNTNWINAEKALLNLYKNNVLNPNIIAILDIKKLKELIKCAGFYNQKSVRIKEFTHWFLLNLDRLNSIKREELLKIKGIGKETADTILLYALKKPFFVIDSYTMRFCYRLGINFKNYDDLQEIFQISLEQDFRIYNEYHALIVEHCKRFCKKTPNCDICILKTICQKRLD
ncbi:MAG: endonuclease III domain-containing protein [Candidatus Woesearchaeota archaeon]